MPCIETTMHLCFGVLVRVWFSGTCSFGGAIPAPGLKAAVKGLVLDEDAVCALQGVIFTSPLVGMPAAVCSQLRALLLALATL